MTTEDQSTQPGPAADRTVAGRYRLRATLGRGGMGTVWLADDDVLQRPVAVKEVFLPHGITDEQRSTVRERVLREARAAARLDHAGAVRVYDVVEEDGHPWIVMEVLTGRTLADEIKEHGPLPVHRVTAIGLCLLDALQAAHRAGIVHRDVKPANVQLCDGDRVVLTDFGIASTAGDSSLTQTGELVGSPAYMSPERARGSELGPASDLFSLGATLYAAVEGRPPFDKDSPVATLTALVHEPPDPFRRAGPLRPVLEGLLAKEPERRMGPEQARTSMEAVARGELPPGLEGDTATLAAIATADDPPAAVPNDPASTQVLAPARTPRRRGGRRLRLSLGAIAIFVAATLVAYFLAIRTDSPVRNAFGGSEDGPFTPGHGGVPSGWVAHHDQGQGWTIYTPTGWVPQSGDGVQRFRRPPGDTYGYIAIAMQPGTSDPKTVTTSRESSFASAHDIYHRISIKTVSFRGHDAQLWDFTYQDSGADLRANQLAFTADGPKGKAVYILWFQTKPDGWSASQQLRTELIHSFDPAP